MVMNVLTLYIFIQIICMIFICIGNFNFSNVYLLELVKYLLILINLMVCTNKKINIKLKLIFLFIAIADLFFLFFDSCLLGTVFFIIVQLLYMDYLINIKNKYIYLLPIINLVFALIFKEKIIILESVIYGILLFSNILLINKKEETNNSKQILKKSLCFLLICDIIIASRFIFSFESNFILNILDSFEWIFYLISQIYLVIYSLNLYDSFLYRLLQPIFTFIFKFYYKPTIVNKEYIPSSGAAIIAGNHKHALDPILVDVCTKRVVHTLAKKDLHDGAFGWFFRAIGTIPVDLKKSTNKSASNAATEQLKEGNLINLSPEAKRNYTEELLLPFKYGAVSMAKKTGCEIIPYSITGDYKLFSNNLKIVFGKPINVSKLEIEKANEKLFNSIKKLLKENIDKDELKTKKMSEYKGIVSSTKGNS